MQSNMDQVDPFPLGGNSYPFHATSVAGSPGLGPERQIDLAPPPGSWRGSTTALKKGPTGHLPVRVVFIQDILTRDNLVNSPDLR